MNFSDLNLNPDLLEGIKSMGYQNPTPIQAMAIPALLQGQDILACAQTGTGKTASFLIPIMQQILNASNRNVNALIVAPTRELVIQIDQFIDGLGYYCGVGSIAIYGGNDGIVWEQQKRALKEGVNIVCATPGRLLALIQAGHIDFSNIKHLVLDEADKMLDMGFVDDIRNIVKQLPVKRQTILFSATMPLKIRNLAKTIANNPLEINIAINKPAAAISQKAYSVFDNQKEKLLNLILKNPDYQSVIVFSSTKENVKKLEHSISNYDSNVKAFHSDLEQSTREQIMRDFKSKKIKILIGTDILSRGIDIDGISLVINYDVPSDPEDYVHRIGRTARADKSGDAITFINPKDQAKFYRIENLIGEEIEKLPLLEEFGEYPIYDPEKIKSGKTGEKKRYFKKRFKK